MTEPSQYFKGRTVQEQMDEVIGYVDKRAEEVAAAKADAVLQPAEEAKTAAQAAAEAAEAAKNTTLAALPEIRQDISRLKAEDAALDGRLDTVELKVQTAEGNIVTIQGQIVALQTADGQNVKINNINQYAVGLTGNQDNIAGIKTFISGILNLATENPEIRYYDDRNKTNLISGVGVRYKTATSTNAAIKSYAPKIDPTDSNEIQRGGFLQLISNQDGTMTLNVFGTKADGSLASKVIASFNGTAWS